MKYIKQLSLTLALLITAVGGAWAEDTYTVTFKANGNTKTVENVTLPHTFELDPIITELYPSLSGGHGSPAGTSASGNTNVTAYNNDSKHYASISAPFEGAVTVTGQFFKDFTNHQYTLEINCMEKLVAISDDKTEATIKMPKYDVTATYTLKRDLTVDVAGEMAERVRIKKDGNNYQPVGADGNIDANAALPTVTDNLDANTPVDMTKDTDYTLTLQKQGETEDSWTDVTALSVGTFRYKVTGTGNYSGEIITETFKLYEGYEVEVPAGEYVTYYKDEALKVEDADAKLYTITAVDETAATATLSDAMTVTPANTPLLVYNSSEDTKNFLLIPTTDEADNVTAAEEFKGTLEATQIAASTTTQNNYAFNGKAFVWMKNDIAIAANKAWLEIGSEAAGARSVVLVFSDSLTGVNLTPALSEGEGAWYDLSGRKLQGKPTKSGVYINNGKKVTIK